MNWERMGKEQRRNEEEMKKGLEQEIGKRREMELKRNGKRTENERKRTEKEEEGTKKERRRMEKEKRRNTERM